MSCAPIYKEAVIIGNGPSAITLSYLLAGNWPYYEPIQAHPNEYLHARLSDDELANTSLVQLDLEYLSNGLHGRSFNPVSVLFDQLQHPEADFGIENPSTLSWKFNSDRKVDHVVLGKGLPGGKWHKMDDCAETLTISLGSWMQLPNMEIREWMHDCKRSESRVSLSTVANYYKDYVENQGLSSYFRNYSTVSSVCFNKRLQLYEIIGRQDNCNFKYLSPRVILATGHSDKPNRLNVQGEDLPFVLHSLNELEHLLKNTQTHQLMDPLLIVGAGLSAADAVIAARFKRIPIVHAFRRHPDDPALVFNQLPENMYPEYHKVHSKMKGRSLPSNGYKPFSMHCVKEIRGNKEVVLSNMIGAEDTQLTTSVTIKVSYVLVLIGMKPDISFIKPKSLRQSLGIHPKERINSHSNPIKINPYTSECRSAPGLYAVGPLVGDTFVRFVQGGALAIANHIWSNKP